MAYSVLSMLEFIFIKKQKEILSLLHKNIFPCRNFGELKLVADMNPMEESYAKNCFLLDPLYTKIGIKKKSINWVTLLVHHT